MPGLAAHNQSRLRQRTQIGLDSKRVLYKAFDAKLSAAFATIDGLSATKDDYYRKVVEVLCAEVVLQAS